MTLYVRQIREMYFYFKHPNLKDYTCNNLIISYEEIPYFFMSEKNDLMDGEI